MPPRGYLHPRPGPPISLPPRVASPTGLVFGERRSHFWKTGPAERPGADRTRYYFDVRDQDEYIAGHAIGPRLGPGGQLVQETDFYAPVRGAEIVLADDDGTRANVTGSWLAQMGWDVAVVDDALQGPLETGPWSARPVRVLAAPGVPTDICAGLLADVTARVVEVGRVRPATGRAICRAAPGPCGTTSP